MAKNKRNNSPIENLVRSVIQNRGSLYRHTYGTSDTVIKDLDKDASIISSVLNSFINDKEKDNGNIVNQLSAYSNKKYTDNNREMTKLNEILGDRENLDIVSAMYMELKPRLELYKDFENLYELVPQLKDAVWTIRDNILSPDDFSKVILNISYDNTNEAMESLIKKVKKGYKLDKKAKRLVEKTLVYGEQYISVIPYKDAFERMLNDKNANNPYATRKLTESIWKLPSSEFNNPEIFKAWESTCNNIEFCEGVENIDVSSLKNTYEFLHESKTLKIGNSLIDKAKIKNTKVTAQDGTISQDNQISISGSYVKILDVKKIIPIIINDTCLGYYYIEIGDNLLSNTDYITGNINRFTLKNVFNNNIEIRDKMYEKLANTIYENLDKKFIENNKNLKKFIYEMIQYHDAIDKRIKIIYLKPEEVVAFKINEDEDGRGKGIFYDILFIAKIYLSLMITNTMMRLTRKPDKRVYYVKQGVNKEVGRSIQNALIQLKKDQGSIYDINHISRIMSFAGRFSDLFIPVADNGDKPIDFDVMAGQDVEMRDEFIETIERIMVNGTGVPNALYNNYGSEVDYARTLSMANGKFIRLIVSYQFDFEDPFTECTRKICYSEINNDNEGTNSQSYNIDSIKVTLPSPVTLNLTNSIDLFNNVNQMVDNILQTELGDEQSNDPRLTKHIRRKLIRNFMPNIDWDYIDKIVKNAGIDSAIESNSPKNEESQM